MGFSFRDIMGIRPNVPITPYQGKGFAAFRESQQLEAQLENNRAVDARERERTQLQREIEATNAQEEARRQGETERKNLADEEEKARAAEAQVLRDMQKAADADDMAAVETLGNLLSTLGGRFEKVPGGPVPSSPSGPPATSMEAPPQGLKRQAAPAARPKNANDGKSASELIGEIQAKLDRPTLGRAKEEAARLERSQAAARAAPVAPMEAPEASTPESAAKAAVAIQQQTGAGQVSIEGTKPAIDPNKKATSEQEAKAAEQRSYRQPGADADFVAYGRDGKPKFRWNPGVQREQRMKETQRRLAEAGQGLTGAAMEAHKIASQTVMASGADPDAAMAAYAAGMERYHGQLTSLEGQRFAASAAAARQGAGLQRQGVNDQQSQYLQGREEARKTARVMEANQAVKLWREMKSSKMVFGKAAKENFFIAKASLFKLIKYYEPRQISDSDREFFSGSLSLLDELKSKLDKGLAGELSDAQIDQYANAFVTLGEDTERQVNQAATTLQRDLQSMGKGGFVTDATQNGYRDAAQALMSGIGMGFQTYKESQQSPQGGSLRSRADELLKKHSAGGDDDSPY